MAQAKHRWQKIVGQPVADWYAPPGGKFRPRYIHLTLWQRFRAWRAGLL